MLKVVAKPRQMLLTCLRLRVGRADENRFHDDLGVKRKIIVASTRLYCDRFKLLSFTFLGGLSWLSLRDIRCLLFDLYLFLRLWLSLLFCGLEQLEQILVLGVKSLLDMRTQPCPLSS